MSKRLVALLTAVALVGITPAIAPAATPAASQHAPIAVAAKTCSSGFKHARIGGRQKCLRRGEYCAKRYRNQYRKYGHRCVRRHGAYRLT
jgi:hypothetical protein